MSQKTIECRLYAPSDSLRYLWKLMSEKNTPLVNELLYRVSHHEEFEEWFKTKKISQKPIKDICQPLRDLPQYQNQPGRFFTSAIALTHYIYKSWFAVQARLQRKIEGKQRWLNILKSDAELEAISGSNIEKIVDQAHKILKEAQNNLKSDKQGKKKKQKKDNDLFQHFMNEYELRTDILDRCAIAYLLKNQCQIPDEIEDIKQFQQYRRKKEIEIERHQQQLENRLPQGRDLTQDKWLETLTITSDKVPETEEEASEWQSRLLKKSPVIPYPIAYETNIDLTWIQDQRGHLLVKFNGLSKHQFELRCDRRQLHWFQRFWEDQQTYKQDSSKYSSALFTLRSARILWREEQGKGNPWEVHKLYLQCSIDTRFWTAEGTNQIAQEKSQKTKEKIDKHQEKSELTPNQLADQKRKESSLARINTSYPRPHKKVYQGNPNIILGVSFGLQKPATVAVVNVITQDAIVYRSIKQLLGDNYSLLNRQRQQKIKLSKQRHHPQKQDKFSNKGESNLGEYIDRLIARAIVQTAKFYQAQSIVLPKLTNIKESILSEVQAKAETKIMGYKKAQKKYAKEYRKNIHQWSYSRLTEYISQLASQEGIAIEFGSQPKSGTPQEKAKTTALNSYNCRLEKSA